MILNQETVSAGEAYLEHYGIKGMRWGVRREQPTVTGGSSSAPKPNLKVLDKGVTVRADGSIVIEKGASLQRLVRSNGKSLPMKDITYASLSDYDNARYIKEIGGKGIFGGGRDQILGIQATKKITAPTKEEATRIVSELMVKDPTFRKNNTSIFGDEITKRELRQIEQDPTGRTAQAWYDSTNQRLTFSKFKGAAEVQQTVRETFMAKGYNALRDENDVGSGLAKSPVIIFDPASSLKVTSVTTITDELRRANKEKLQQYKSMGKGWVDEQLYGTHSW